MIASTTVRWLLLVAGTFILLLNLGSDFALGAGQGQDDPAPRAWPMFGGSPGRNMVNLLEKNLPADWCVEEGKRKNIKWVAELGTSLTFGSPVVAGGRVFVATNNNSLCDPQAARAVMKALRESDGKLLWQIEHAYPGDDFVHPAGATSLPSTPAVEGRSIYYLTPGCEVICADTDSGKITWRYDMMKELKVVPYQGDTFRSPSLASPLVVGDLVFVVTGNGTDGEKIVSPKAPSFVALHKKTGKLAWRSNLPGENIIEGQWSSPTFADAGGRRQVIFAGGDCVIYSLAPDTGALLWKCDCLPTRNNKKKGRPIDQYIVGAPVVVGDRLYVGMGLHADHWDLVRASYFLCLDVTRKGDVSLKSYDVKAPENKGSALVWAFGGPIEPRPKKGRGMRFGRTLSTAAVHDGLVYISEEAGYLHCLDAATGKQEWQHDLKAGVWGSPYWVDGRVLVGKDEGAMAIFAHGRAAKLLARIDMHETILTTPVAANGALYVATRRKLYAIGSR